MAWQLVLAVGVAMSLSGGAGYAHARWRDWELAFGWIAGAILAVGVLLLVMPSHLQLAPAVGVAAALLSAPTLLPTLFAFQAMGETRRRSLVDGYDRVSLLLSAIASLAVVGWLASLRAPHTLLALTIAAVGAVATVVLWTRQATRVRRIGDLLRDARPHPVSSESDPEPVDLGIGDDRWSSIESGDHPYRRPDRVGLLVRGAPFVSQRHLVNGLVADGLCAMATVAAAIHAFAMRPAAVVNHLSAPVTVGVEAPARAMHTWAWYPQTEPIIVDLNGDGTEDVVGLRWDSSHEEAALSIVATDGATFQTIWSTKRIKSQWSSPRTKLVRGGDRLFLLDSERQLFIHDLRTGNVVIGPLHLDAGEAPEACATREGELFWVRDTRDWEHGDQGTLVDATGTPTTSRRPDACKRRWGPRSCDEAGEGKCVRSRPVKPKDGLHGVHAADSLEEADAGVTFAAARVGDRWGRRGSYLVGYEPHTGARRWERPLAFTADAMHADPRLDVELARGKVYGIYQLADGRWLVGARDAKTGELAWQREPPRSTHGTNFRSLHVTRQRLYVILDWRVEVFDPDTGAPLGTIGYERVAR